VTWLLCGWCGGPGPSGAERSGAHRRFPAPRALATLFPSVFLRPNQDPICFRVSSSFLPKEKCFGNPGAVIPAWAWLTAAFTRAPCMASAECTVVQSFSASLSVCIGESTCRRSIGIAGVSLPILSRTEVQTLPLWGGLRIMIMRCRIDNANPMPCQSRRLVTSLRTFWPVKLLSRAVTCSNASIPICLALLLGNRNQLRSDHQKVGPVALPAPDVPSVLPVAGSLASIYCPAGDLTCSSLAPHLHPPTFQPV
jgi:hypothetical protein